MGTSVDRRLTASELDRMPVARQEMEAAGAQGCATRFAFFAAFDGTNNHKDYPERAGDRWQTNIGNLFDQAEAAQGTTLQARYYPGVGTGGDQGGLIHAGVLPTQAIEAAANKAYTEFSDAAISYLKTQPGATPADLGVAVAGFSRGGASAIRFAQLVNERGLVGPDGEVVAPPGSVPVTAMALIDPVARFVKTPMDIPPNVQGLVLSVIAQHESRTDFRPLYYIDDPRVTHVEHPGNHVGTGGGYDPQGTAASVLEGVTGYFQNRGVAIAEVPPERRHDPQAPQRLYTEVWQTARNGEVLEDDQGSRQSAWRHDPPEQGRVGAVPHLSEQHMNWLRQAYVELAPELKAQGLGPDRCLQVAAACVCSAARHEARWGTPREFLLSGDGRTVGVQHENLRLDTFPLEQALRTPAQEHLQAAEREQQANTAEHRHVLEPATPALAR